MIVDQSRLVDARMLESEQALLGAVCEKKSLAMEDNEEGDFTFKTRDDAARAEYELVQAMHASAKPG